MARVYTRKPQSAKKDQYYIYRVLNQYLLTFDETKKEQLLNELCKDPNESKKVRMRSLLLFQAFPEILYKFNKYVNSFNSILSNATDREWFEFFSKLIEPLNLKFNKFYKSKYNAHEYTEFSQTVKKYFEQIDEIPSDQELQLLFVLYKESILSQDILDDINDNEGSVEKPKSSKTQQKVLNPSKSINSQNILVSSKDSTYDNLSDDVKHLCDTFKSLESGICVGCKCYYNKQQKILIDSNVTNLSIMKKTDVVFVTIHPLLEDLEKRLPLSGKTSTILRDTIDIFLNKYPNFTYGIVSLVSCVFNDQFDPSTEIINKCFNIYKVLIDQLNPKIIVLMGDKVWKNSNIKGPISKINAIPIMHETGLMILPTSDIIHDQSTRSKNYFNKLVEQLINILDTDMIKGNLAVNQNGNHIAYNIASDKIITSLTDEYTLLDIKELNNQLLYIVKDKNNIKRYYFDNSKIPIYIKTGNYLNCNMITDTVDYTVTLNHFELAQLNKKLYQDMQHLIK